ncbi:MAG: chemotaxis protein CheC [Lachnospiraceae bacterium]|nr:chemotaxis protein CheC [Lachnospiraceae bacterium]
MNLENVSDMYCDVLKEIGNIGAGNATTAIASMLGVKVDMKVPSVKFMDVSEMGGALGDEEAMVVGIFLEVELDINGSMMFIMDMDSAHFLVNSLMMRDKSYMEDFDEMDLSAIKEIGNIIAASYLSALSGLTGMTISPSVPYLAIDMAAAILSVPAIQFGVMGDNALMIQTEFGDDYQVKGSFILMPDEDSYDKILKSLGVVM